MNYSFINNPPLFLPSPPSRLSTLRCAVNKKKLSVWLKHKSTLLRYIHIIFFSASTYLLIRSLSSKTKKKHFLLLLWKRFEAMSIIIKKIHIFSINHYTTKWISCEIWYMWKLLSVATKKNNNNIIHTI